MVIMFDNKLDIKSFEQFSISIEDGLSKTNENDKLIIFFSTPGGSVIAAYAFYELFKKYKDYIQTLAKEGYNLVVNPHWLNVMDYELHNSHLNKSDYNRSKKDWNKLLKTYNISNFILEELGGKELEFKTIV